MTATLWSILCPRRGHPPSGAPRRRDQPAPSTEQEERGGRRQATPAVSVRSASGYVTRMKDLICPECNASISFASASVVACCTLCGADLDLPSVELSEGSGALGAEVSPGAVRGS